MTLASIAALFAAASLTWNGIFQNDMVLQCDREVRVWGGAEPGETVRVTFAGQDVSARAGTDGFWCATLKPLAATCEGRVLAAQCGAARLEAKNVVVGEVWLCSGQSNMQQPMWGGGWGGGWSDQNGIIESNLAKYPNIRAFTAKARESDAPLEETVGVWRALTTPAAIRKTYATGFYFARCLLRARPGVPVGLMEAAWGGRSIQPFIPAAAYTGKACSGERTIGRIYNAEIHPWRRFAIRGAIWWQGENNIVIGETPIYANLLHQLADGWRAAFGDPDLPFYLTEIAPFRWERPGCVLEFQREVRRFAHEDPHAACIVINDCGDPDTVHPDRKENVGLRFALCALNRCYGRKDLACDAPEAVSAVSEAGAVIVTCTNTAVLGVNSYPVYTQHRVHGFELAGADGVWHPATQVELIRHRIRASNPDVPDPVKIRYLGRNDEAGTVYAGDTNLRLGAFELKAPASTIDPELQAKCQAVCDWAVREGLQGAVQFCAYRDGKCIVDVCAGTMTTNAGAPAITGSTLYPIFSTEKPLLATAVHRLVEQRKMDYDKPLSTWWPGFTGNGKEKLTLGLTLGYRSGIGPGFPKGIKTVDDECNWKKICSLAEKEPPVEAVGVRQRYMSLSYAWALGRPLEGALKRPLNDILVDEVLRPSGIEHDFYFAADDAALKRIGTAYRDRFYEQMNDDRRRRMCLPSAFAVANARALARFYNRLCGFDGERPLVSKATLDRALEPCRHPSDPLPDAAEMKRNWYMIFGMGYGLWGAPERLGRLFGHGGVGGSEGLCDRDRRLTVGFTNSFDQDVRKVRSKLYGIVGMKWRYWDDAEADIQNMQMSTIRK